MTVEKTKDTAADDAAAPMPAIKMAARGVDVYYGDKQALMGIDLGDAHRRLAERAEPHRLLIAESGLFTPGDLARMAGYGARTFLIGESLMRQDDVAAATRTLLANPASAGGL